MALNVTRGKLRTPRRVYIYGEDGIGKTTWASGAEDVVFLDTERSTDGLDVARLPAPQTLDDVRQSIASLMTEDHGFKALAIDSIDWLQQPVFDAVCAEARVQNIEDIGYGKGYVYAEAKWQKMLGALTELSQKRDMHIILVGHSQIVQRKSVTLDDWQANGVDLHKRLAPLTREWATEVLFAHREEMVIEEDDRFGSKKKKGTASGRRLLGTEKAAGYEAKNRLEHLPAVIEMTRDAKNFWDIVKQEYADAAS